MNSWLHAPAPGAPCTIVGEVAQAHDGSLGAAHAYIDAIAAAGADAVKFQTHIAAAESTAAEPWRKRFSPQRSEEHTSELQSLMRTSYAVFCLKKKKTKKRTNRKH